MADTPATPPPPPEPLPPTMTKILEQIQHLQGEVVGLKAALAAPHPETVKEDLKDELEKATKEIAELKAALKEHATPAQRRAIFYWWER